MDTIRRMPRPIIRAPVDGKCRVCGSTEFTTRNRCKPCNRAKQKAGRAKDPEKARAQERERLRRWRSENPKKRRAHDLRHRHGLSEEELAKMLVAQGNLC